MYCRCIVRFKKADIFQKYFAYFMCGCCVVLNHPMRVYAYNEIFSANKLKTTSFKKKKSFFFLLLTSGFVDERKFSVHYLQNRELFEKSIYVMALCKLSPLAFDDYNSSLRVRREDEGVEWGEKRWCEVWRVSRKNLFFPRGCGFSVSFVRSFIRRFFLCRTREGGEAFFSSFGPFPLPH